MISFPTTKPFLCLFCAALLLAGCSTVASEYNEETLKRIAMPAFMVERSIPAGKFNLTAWERIHQKGAPANVYIEGDSFPWGLTIPEGDIFTVASPDNPVAMHLSSRDKSKNLIYLARPCQYDSNRELAGCDEDGDYWLSKRFSPEVIDSYMIVLDEISARYGITGFNIIGYGGGANIAAILAGNRDDILSLRTVAGNLNPDLTAHLHEGRSVPEALNATDIAPRLADLPQHHFVGAVDEIIPPAVYHSFRQAMGPTNCLHYTVIEDADHERGWVEKWPALLQMSISCLEVVEPRPLPPSPHNDGLGKEKYRK